MPATPPAVVTFGELLLRLDTPRYERFQQAATLNVSFTGGEANVAVALSQWGLPAKIVSRVPAHEIGTTCLNHFRRYGVETEFVARGGERLGILFVETGASQRPPKVIYDRLQTSFRTSKPGDYDWDQILDGAGWFHVTGTAPALGEAVLGILQEALQQTRDRQIPVSFDSSYRSALWSIDAAAAAFQGLMPYVDVFLGSESDAGQFFGIQAQGEQALLQLRDKYQLRCVAFSEREVQPSGAQAYSSKVATESGICRSRTHHIDVVDRIGTGDAFAAGIIRGLLLNEPLDRMTEQATAAAVLAHSIPGDFALVSWEEVQNLAASTSGAPPPRGWR